MDKKMVKLDEILAIKKLSVMSFHLNLEFLKKIRCLAIFR
jgi:hypothetical protein